MRVLLVEDHPAMRDMMTAHLRQSGFVTEAVAGGGDALAALARLTFDAVVLDLGLPDLDGLDVLKRMRGGLAAGLPVLVLTARDAVSDRVSGLDAGADDYLLKPFDLDEFDARLRSVLRRNGTRREAVLCLGPLEFDVAAREARVAGAAVELTRRELSLLEELMRAAGRTVVRETLEERLYGPGEPVSGNALEAVVSRLRRHLATVAPALAIETLRGIGYRLRLRPEPLRSALAGDEG